MNCIVHILIALLIVQESFAASPPFRDSVESLSSSHRQSERHLQATAWKVTIGSAVDQRFTFSTGPGGSRADVKVEVYDKCRREARTRHDLGQLYPDPSVNGLGVDLSGVQHAPGNDNTISFKFMEGIAENTYIYTPGPGDTGKVQFCTQVSLYENRELINFAELKLIYDILDLTQNFVTLTGYMVVQEDGFMDEEEQTDPGELLAYFCDPDTRDTLMGDPLITQGSLVNVCFKFRDGQFEIKDVIDMTIEEETGWPYQDVIFGGFIQWWSTPYATQTCSEDTHGTNICMVSFLLQTDFYDYGHVTLTGSGAVLLEFDDAARTRRTLKVKFRTLQSDLEEPYQIPPVDFTIIDGSGSTTTGCLFSLLLSTLVALAALGFVL